KLPASATATKGTTLRKRVSSMDVNLWLTSRCKARQLSTPCRCSTVMGATNEAEATRSWAQRTREWGHANAESGGGQRRGVSAGGEDPRAPAAARARGARGAQRGVRRAQPARGGGDLARRAAAVLDAGAHAGAGDRAGAEPAGRGARGGAGRGAAVGAVGGVP